MISAASVVASAQARALEAATEELQGPAEWLAKQVEDLSRELQETNSVTRRQAISEQLKGTSVRLQSIHMKMANIAAQYVALLEAQPMLVQGARAGLPSQRADEPKPAAAAASRRSSCLSSKSFGAVDSATAGLPGGRLVTLETNSELLGPLECIVAEPLGKRLSPDNYVATGLMIILHGYAPTADVLQEWGTIAKQVRWLDLGMSVVLPNLEMTSALTLADLECVVEATLKLVELGTCVLVGKAWGALRTIELATSPKLQGKVEGVILMAPSSPPPMMCPDVNVPVLIVWARDDNIEDFAQSGTWLEELDNRNGPTTFQAVESGGHNFASVLESVSSRGESGAAAALALRNFTVSCLLLADLDAIATGETNEMSARAVRLSAELPGFITELAAEDADGEQEEAGDEAAAPPDPEATQVRQTAKRMSNVLPDWIQSGMPTASE